MTDLEKLQNHSALIQNFYNAPDEALFDQRVVAQIRGCSLATMERDRWAGGGIPFRKIGRQVRYKKADVLSWLNSHELKNNTTD